VKLAVVVQRYGADISGGAETEARYFAEHLARHVAVDVFTTCARDYVTWRNELRAGVERVNGIAVHRFPVDHPRSVQSFATHSNRVFDERHSIADELAWLESEGPTSTALVRHVRAVEREYDYFIFFCYRYYHSYHGVRAVPSKALLVPTAERDPAIGVGVFQPIFRGVRALMYNTPEERAMIGAVSGNDDVPGAVVGIGSEVPPQTQPERFRRSYDLRSRFAIYVGRIDENKGCKQLFEFFQRYAATHPGNLMLALIGSSVLPIPPHPRIRHLGFLSDEDKFDAIAAADVLIMPSLYESLSIVALEAWALGRPVLANGRCDVLQGQCLRSNAGLYYDNYDEFAEALYRVQTDRALAEALGQNGRRFYCQHYTWPIIERKYLDVLDQLQAEDHSARRAAPLEPLPGWFARRQRTLAPARGVMNQLPAGPAMDGRTGKDRHHG
jgi:glycosyltransferase involved in cell wall biosynthesis